MKSNPKLDSNPIYQKQIRRSQFLLVITIILALSAVSLHAGIITVESGCTLTDAILSANSDTDVGSCTGASGTDTIVLNVDVNLLTADTVNSTEQSGTFAGLPDLTSEVTIQAGTASTIERDASLTCESGAADAFRLLNVTGGGQATLEGLSLVNGCARAGGAIYAKLSELTVDGCVFSSNTARVEDGITTPAAGGAIFFNAGTMIITESTFVGNRALGSSGKEGGRAEGGTLWRGGSGGFTVGPGNSFVDNLAVGGDGTDSGGDAKGGVFYADTDPVSGSIHDDSFSGNEARGGDGGTGDGGSASGGAIFISIGDGTIRNLLLESNKAVGGNSSASDGGRGSGGGANTKITLVENIMFISNEANGGDGISGGKAQGGALYPESTTNLSRLSMVNNIANGGAGTTGPGGEAFGGALATTSSSSALHLTISGNRAQGGDSVSGVGGDAHGGGWSESSKVYNTKFFTIYGNQAIAGVGGGGDGVPDGGGLEENGSMGIYISNSLILGNTAGVSGGPMVASDCSSDIGVLISEGYNLVQTPGTCVFAATGDQTGVDALVLPIDDYGCSTPLLDGTCLLTHAFQLAGPGYDQGSCTASGATEDARERSRPWDDPTVINIDDGCDIGAYEARDTDGNGVDDDYESLFEDGFESGDTSAWSSTNA